MRFRALFCCNNTYLSLLCYVYVHKAVALLGISPGFYRLHDNHEKYMYLLGNTCGGVPEQSYIPSNKV